MGTKIYTKAEREKIERDKIAKADRESHAKQRHAPPAAEQRALVKLGDATRMLAEVRDASGAKHVMDLASAAELYAKKAKMGQEAIGYATGIKLEAERLLGQHLKEQPKAKGGGDARSETHRITGSKPEPVIEQPPTLAEMGIPRKLAAEAQRLASIPDEQFAAVKSGAVKMSVAFRDQKRSTLGTRIAALPAGMFRVLYADPPWKYGDERGGLEKADTAAAGQYPTMPTQAICDFTDDDGRHVKDLAAKDSVLFMWATFPLLEDGLRVVATWGFDYKTAIVWDKQRSNIGNYHDARAELLLIATRGSCPIEIDTRPKQVQSIPRGKHSAKPEEFRALIDLMYPSGPRVELFRRGEAPKGWTVYGNEAVAA